MPPPQPDAVPDRLDRASLAVALAQLLARQPRARLLAIGEHGLVVPLPPSLRPGHHELVSGVATALDLVALEDAPQVMAAWEAAHARGAARVAVHPAAGTGDEAELIFIDARDAHGVYLGFLFGGRPEAEAPAPAPPPALRPRYGVMRKDRDGLVVSYDDATAQMLGWQPDAMAGHDLLETAHPDDHQRAMEAWDDLLGHPGQARRVRLRHRRPRGGWVWVETTDHNLLDDPEHGIVLAELVDVTDEMAAVDALHASEEVMRRLTDALPVGVLQLAADGRVVYRNGRVSELLAEDVAVGASVLDLRHASAPLALAVAQILRDGDDAEVELGRQPLVSGPRRLHAILRALRGPDGAISGAIACLSDVTEAAELRDELRFRAAHDALTGCLNRDAILARLEAVLGSGARVQVAYVDLDGFKLVNDQHGHAAGDALLRHVGAGLLAFAGAGVLVGRVGGDEFLVVAQDVELEASAIGAALGDDLILDGYRLAARASIGIARSAAGMDADALVAAADAAMYGSKGAPARRSA